MNEQLKPSGLHPEKELLTPDGYRWFVYSEQDTGLRLVCFEDLTTGVVVSTALANPDKRTASHKAWAGARQSRAPGTSWEIMREMGEKGIDPDQKLEETFSTYGHASVGDMARLQVDFAGIPMHLCWSFFNDGAINSGQEKSTRYQSRFNKAVLHDFRHYLPEGFDIQEFAVLEADYQELGDLSLQNFARYQEMITPVFQEFYKPESSRDQAALGNRVLDCVRYFLLLGQNSGMSFETSARDWSRIIGELKAAPVGFYSKVARQLERLFTPTPDEEAKLRFKAEAPGLIRHADALGIANENLLTLRDFIGENSDLLTEVTINQNFRGRVEQGVELLSGEYSEADKMVAQYFLTIWPGLDKRELLGWVHNQDSALKLGISEIIFGGHDNYKELPIPLSSTRGMSLVFETYLGELRDLNRHRAWGRFVPLPLVFGAPMDRETARQILARGFGLPLYLTKIPEFGDLQEKFEEGLSLYYQKLLGFVSKVNRQYGSAIDYSFIVNLLPLAHQMDIWMHGDPKQALYMPDQRTKPGGHINYRDLTWQANKLLADSDPYLSGLRLGGRPDPASKEEFFNRS